MINGLRPDELFELLRALDEVPSGTAPVLATVVSHEGSVYERAGAMALLLPEAASRTGVLGLNELERGDLRDAAQEVAQTGKPRLLELDLKEDGALTSWNLGAPGRMEVFLEPAGSAVRGCLEDARRLLLEGKGVVLSLDVTGPNAGRRRVLPPEDPQAAECFREMSPELFEASIRGALRRVLLCPIHAMGKALIMGSSRDASALARHLHELGFAVTVADPRPGRLRSADWDRRSALLVEGGWGQLRAAAGPDEETSIVVMTHSYALDLETLQGALESPAPYVGVVGSAKRAQRLRADLAKLGAEPRPGQFHAPAGLDVGAESPREIALAVAAEILAVRSGRKGGRLSPRRAPVQGAPAAHSVPGLILAAGRGKRFAGGGKLTALVDGQPVLRRVVENALASRLDPVIVVLGHEAGRALEALRGLDDPRLRVVFNPRWEGGKSSSIECGLRELPFLAPGVVALLGDMPRVRPWLIDRVIAEFELSGKLVFPVFDDGRRGYPTAYPRALFPEIRALTGDGTADEAVRRHWAESVRIQLPDGSTQADIDTPEDLELLAMPAESDSLETH